MSAPQVVLRCDAGPTIGAGHLVRSLALAEGFLRCGAEATLLTGPLPEVWRAMVLRREVTLLEHGALGPGLAGVGQLGTGSPALAVLDGYDFAAEHVAAWRERTGLVALIADHGPDHGADAVIDHNLGARAERYPGARLTLLGPRHALLREEFRDPPVRRPETDPPTVLVTLGGSATHDLLPRVIAGLEAAGRPLVARVIAGPHDSPGASPASRARAASPIEVVRVPPGPGLRDELEGAILALLAAGGVRFEAARLGVPMVLGILADNQEPDARAFAEAGAARVVGWWREATPDAVGARVRELLDDEGAREALAARGRSLVDGRGAERAARALLRAAGRST